MTTEKNEITSEHPAEMPVQKEGKKRGCLRGFLIAFLVVTALIILFLMFLSLASSQFLVGSTSAEVNSFLLIQMLHQNFKASHRNYCTINLLSDFLSLYSAVGLFY